MRPCTAAVRALLDGWNPLSEVTLADLYTFTLVSGEVFRFSSWQDALSAPAPETDAPLIDFVIGPAIDRNKTKTQIGIEIDTLDVEIYTTGSDLVANGGTISWQDALRQGLFDGASCEVWRCLMTINPTSPYPTVVGTITWFFGNVGDVEIGRTKCTLHVKSLLNILKVQMPKRLFQSGCMFVFGGAECGFNREVDGAAGPGGGGPAYAMNVTCDAGTNQSQIHVTGLAPAPATLFAQGTIYGLTGANTGYKRTIVSVASEVIYILNPWIFPVVIGDTFRLLPGCDHTLDTCLNVMNNRLADGSAKDGGFPYIPPPETAV